MNSGEEGVDIVATTTLKRSLLSAALIWGAVGLSAGEAPAQQPPIKVGILHSLSGTMAISETTLKDTILMLVDEQNKRGGLLGRKL